MLELGKVTAVMNDNVQVQFKRTSACDKCRACSIDQGGKVSITLKNDLGAKVGDIVEVEIWEKAVTLSYLIVFGIPLVMLLLGIILASMARFNELYSIITAASSLVFGFLIVFVIDKIIGKNQRFAPKIIKVYNQNSQKSEELKNDRTK